MSKLLSNYEVIVASDVSIRDGVGIEIYLNKECILEIFRDDTKKAREITLYRKDLPLELIEEAIVEFKAKIPWDYQD